MTTVRIAHTVPRPGPMPDGTVAVGEVLVVLADTVPAGDGGHRAVPLRLRASAGKSMWHLLDRPGGSAAMAGVLQETAARLLDAGGVRVTAVDIEPASADVPELTPDTAAARVGLDTAAGPRQVLVSIEYGLALAAAAGAPVRVADEVMGRLAVVVQGADLLAPFLPAAAARPLGRPGQRWRFEPRNMAFTEGLDYWELAGSLPSGGQPDWRNYSCTAAGRSAVLAAAVPAPPGFAVLVQTIYADDYRGAAVTFRGQLRTSDVASRAGLHLAAGRPHEPPATQLRDRGASSLAAPGSTGWTWHSVTVPVSADAGIIRFGISLAGRGRIELRNAEFTVALTEPQE